MAPEALGMLELASERGFRAGALSTYPHPAIPETSTVLASMILWEGMPNCESRRNPVREPNRSRFFRAPGKSGILRVGVGHSGHSRRPGRCCATAIPQLIDGKPLISNYTFGRGTLRCLAISSGDAIPSAVAVAVQEPVPAAKDSWMLDLNGNGQFDGVPGTY
jgi:hypothetical protein